MPHTNTINEAAPAGSDLISGGDNEFRQLKLDVRERMALDHVWATSLDHDGKHLRVRFRSAADVTCITTDSANSLTGATAGGVVDLAQTWNTSGVCTAIKVNITDTASNASSLLMDLQKAGTSQFKVSKNGDVTCLGGITAGSGAVAVIGTTGKIPGISSVYFTSLDASALSNIQETGIADGTLLARVAASETITGAWTMSNASNAFTGSGAGLTALNASNLASGTVPDARFPATLPAASGANLTALNATQLTSGTLPSARLSGTYSSALVLNNTANQYAAFNISHHNLVGKSGTAASLGLVPVGAGENFGWIVGTDNAATTIYIPYWK